MVVPLVDPLPVLLGSHGAGGGVVVEGVGEVADGALPVGVAVGHQASGPGNTKISFLK